jgi:hypothetical protein
MSQLSSMFEMSERVFVPRFLMVFSDVLPGYEKYGDSEAVVRIVKMRIENY